MKHRPTRGPLGLALSLLLALTLTLGCLAASPSSGQKRLVYDQAALLSEEESRRLEGELAALGDRIGMDVGFVTTGDTGGKSARGYADDFYDENSFGAGPDAGGALLLIDMGNRDVYITTHGDMIACLTDDRVESILDGVMGPLGSGDYLAAGQAFANGVSACVDAGPPADQHNFNETRNRPAPASSPQSASSKPKRPVDFAALAISALLSLGAGGACCAGVAAKYNMKTPRRAYDSRGKSSLDLTHKSDQFLRKSVTTRVIPKKPPPGAGGGSAISRSGSAGRSGRSSVHRSSSGRSHGGGSRKF